MAKTGPGGVVVGIQWRTRTCTYTGLGSIRGCDGPSKQNRACAMERCPC